MLSTKNYPLNFTRDDNFKPISFRHSKYKPKSSDQLNTDYEQTLKFASFIGLNSKKQVKHQKKRLFLSHYKKQETDFNFMGVDFSKVVKSSITNRRLNYFDIKSLVQKRKRIEAFIKANNQSEKYKNNFKQNRVHSNKKLIFNNNQSEQQIEYQNIRAKTARQLTRRQMRNKQKQKYIQQLLERQYLDKEQRSKILIEINHDNNPENQKQRQESLNKTSEKLAKSSPKQTSYLNKIDEFGSVNWKNLNVSTTNQSSNINTSPIIISNICNTQSLIFEKQSFSFRPSEIRKNQKILNNSQRLMEFDKKRNNAQWNNQSTNKWRKVVSKSVLIQSKRPKAIKKQIQLKINRKNSKCFQFKYKISPNKK